MSTAKQGDRLHAVVAGYTTLEPFGRDWWRGPCPLPGCADEDEGLILFPSDGRMLFDCASCRRQGDAEDFEAAMQSENGRGPGALSGAVVLEAVVAFVRRFVVLTEAQAELVALWAAHSHALDAADCTPYLNVFSAEKRSGKSRLLEVLDLLAARPWFTGRVTPAVLVHKVADKAPTLLLDETDAVFKGDREYAETLRGVLNAGFRRGGVASLCVGQGANITYRDFPVFGPKAIAGLGRLPDTVADRAIPVELRRRRPSERVERFRLRKAEREAVPVHDALRAWAEANLDALSRAEPELPDELDDRAQDIVEPLLVIADAAPYRRAQRPAGALRAPVVAANIPLGPGPMGI
jgi:hypothetical protein